jgi:RNA polymerase-binding transcription factor DksA
LKTYPEHEKLKAVQHNTQLFKDILDWLGEQGIHLAKFAEDPEALNRDDFEDEDDYQSAYDDRETMKHLSDTYGAMFSVRENTDKMIARWADIDLKVLEDEKQHMLDVQRKLNDGTHGFCSVCGELVPKEELHNVEATAFCDPLDTQALMVLDGAPDKPCCTACVPQPEVLP